MYENLLKMQRLNLADMVERINQKADTLEMDS